MCTHTVHIYNTHDVWRCVRYIFTDIPAVQVPVCTHVHIYIYILHTTYIHMNVLVCMYDWIREKIDQYRGYPPTGFK